MLPVPVLRPRRMCHRYGIIPKRDHPTMTYPPAPTDAEIAEIKRRVVEHRKRPVLAALREATGTEPEMADQEPLTDDLYRWRTGKVRPDTP